MTETANEEQYRVVIQKNMNKVQRGTSTKNQPNEKA